MLIFVASRVGRVIFYLNENSFFFTFLHSVISLMYLQFLCSLAALQIVFQVCYYYLVVFFAWCFATWIFQIPTLPKLCGWNTKKPFRHALSYWQTHPLNLNQHHFGEWHRKPLNVLKKIAKNGNILPSHRDSLGAQTQVKIYWAGRRPTLVHSHRVESTLGSKFDTQKTGTPNFPGSLSPGFF